jgi:hypothetical protein
MNGEPKTDLIQLITGRNRPADDDLAPARPTLIVANSRLMRNCTAERRTSWPLRHDRAALPTFRAH